MADVAPKRAIQRLVRGPDGRTRAILIDLMTLQEVLDPTGYTIVSAGNVQPEPVASVDTPEVPATPETPTILPNIGVPSRGERPEFSKVKDPAVRSYLNNHPNSTGYTPTGQKITPAKPASAVPPAPAPSAAVPTSSTPPAGTILTAQGSILPSLQYDRFNPIQKSFAADPDYIRERKAALYQKVVEDTLSPETLAGTPDYNPLAGKPTGTPLAQAAGTPLAPSPRVSETSIPGYNPLTGDNTGTAVSRNLTKAAGTPTSAYERKAIAAGTPTEGYNPKPSYDPLTGKPTGTPVRGTDVLSGPNTGIATRQAAGTPVGAYSTPTLADKYDPLSSANTGTPTPGAVGGTDVLGGANTGIGVRQAAGTPTSGYDRKIDYDPLTGKPTGRVSTERLAQQTQDTLAQRQRERMEQTKDVDLGVTGRPNEMWSVAPSDVPDPARFGDVAVGPAQSGTDVLSGPKTGIASRPSVGAPPQSDYNALSGANTGIANRQAAGTPTGTYTENPNGITKTNSVFDTPATPAKSVATKTVEAAKTPSNQASRVAGVDTQDISPARAASLGLTTRTTAEKEQIARAIAGEMTPSQMEKLAAGDPVAQKEYANIATTVENRAASEKYGTLDKALVGSQYNSLLDENLATTNANYAKYGKTLTAAYDDFVNGVIKPDDYSLTSYYSPAGQKALGLMDPAWSSDMVTRAGQHKFGTLPEYSASEAYTRDREARGLAHRRDTMDKTKMRSESTQDAQNKSKANDKFSPSGMRSESTANERASRADKSGSGFRSESADAERASRSEKSGGVANGGSKSGGSKSGSGNTGGAGMRSESTVSERSSRASNQGDSETSSGKLGGSV